MCWYVDIRRNHLVGQIAQITRYICIHKACLFTNTYKQAFQTTSCYADWIHWCTNHKIQVHSKSYYASMIDIFLCVWAGVTSFDTKENNPIINPSLDQYENVYYLYDESLVLWMESHCTRSWSYHHHHYLNRTLRWMSVQLLMVLLQECISCMKVWTHHMLLELLCLGGRSPEGIR